MASVFLQASFENTVWLLLWTASPPSSGSAFHPWAQQGQKKAATPPGAGHLWVYSRNYSKITIGSTVKGVNKVCPKQKYGSTLNVKAKASFSGAWIRREGEFCQNIFLYLFFHSEWSPVHLKINGKNYVGIRTALLGVLPLKAMSVNSQKQSVIFKDLCQGVW